MFPLSRQYHHMLALSSADNFRVHVEDLTKQGGIDNLRWCPGSQDSATFHNNQMVGVLNRLLQIMQHRDNRTAIVFEAGHQL